MYSIATRHELCYLEEDNKITVTSAIKTKCIGAALQSNVNRSSLVVYTVKLWTYFIYKHSAGDSLLSLQETIIHASGLWQSNLVSNSVFDSLIPPLTECIHWIVLTSDSATTIHKLKRKTDKWKKWRHQPFTLELHGTSPKRMGVSY